MSRSLESQIDKTHGTFLEIGAVPSNVRIQPMINLERISKHLLVSNFDEQERLEHLFKHRLTGRKLRDPSKTPSPLFYEHIASEPTGERDEGIDVAIDAEDMPLDTGSVGTLYARALPNDLEGQLVNNEGARVLEPGGVLVLERANKAILDASQRYFDVLKVDRLTESSVNFAAVRNDTPYDPSTA